MKRATIVMYHYVRDLTQTKYPSLRALSIVEFKKQLAYFKEHYSFITMEQCLAAIYNDKDLPSNSILLTFDDGYMDHFTTVFPVLSEMGIQGSFFPPLQVVSGNVVLDVNKLQFIFASVAVERLMQEVFTELDAYREEFHLENNENYFTRLAHTNGFDSKEIILIKRLLQRELPKKLRSKILSNLFQKYVCEDETTFARELYLNLDQLKQMRNCGMFIGSHGYSHEWLDRISPVDQEREVDASLELLRLVGAPTSSWVMCYPHGAYNDSLVGYLQNKGCSIGLTTRFDVAHLNKGNAYSLERLDTCHFFPRDKTILYGSYPGS